MITFDIVIRTRKGALFCAYIKRNNEVSGGAVSKANAISVAKAHALLGHSHEDATQATAGYLGWTLMRGSAPCQSCAELKAKQKSVPKESEGEKATEPNGRVFQDLATVKAPEKSGIRVGRPNWQMIVDEHTEMKFSAHHETKSAIVEPTCRKFKKMEDLAGKPVKILRQDNAGKNKKLQE